MQKYFQEHIMKMIPFSNYHSLKEASIRNVQISPSCFPLINHFMPQISLRNGNQNILSHHLHGNRSERGSSRTTVGSSTAISTKYGGDPKAISSWSYWPNMGENRTQLKSPLGKQYWKWYSHKKYGNPREILHFIGQNSLESTNI